MQKLIDEKLKQEQWFPEQIRGDCLTKGIPMLSIERIYQYIRQDKKNGGELYKHLRHRKRPIGGKLPPIKDRVSIDQRDRIVAQKGRAGDWEIDLIIGADQKGAILTMVERKQQYIIIKKLPMCKQAKPLADQLIKLLLPYKKVVHTITSDNGKNFLTTKE